MLENYQLKSGEGLSVLFVITWLLGDITNLGGALIGGLIPTVVILAVYVRILRILLLRPLLTHSVSWPTNPQYTFCDFVLLFQIYYYRRYPRIHLVIEEERPLLTKTVEEPLPKIFLSRTFRYIGGLAFITAAGLVAWRLSGGDEPHDPSNEVFDWTSQALGWASAVLYSELHVRSVIYILTQLVVGSRIPQIGNRIFNVIAFVSIFLHSEESWNQMWRTISRAVHVLHYWKCLSSLTIYCFTANYQVGNLRAIYMCNLHGERPSYIICTLVGWFRIDDFPGLCGRSIWKKIITLDSRALGFRTILLLWIRGRKFGGWSTDWKWACCLRIHDEGHISFYQL